MKEILENNLKKDFSVPRERRLWVEILFQVTSYGLIYSILSKKGLIAAKMNTGYCS